MDHVHRAFADIHFYEDDATGSTQCVNVSGDGREVENWCWSMDTSDRFKHVLSVCGTINGKLFMRILTFYAFNYTPAEDAVFINVNFCPFCGGNRCDKSDAAKKKFEESIKEQKENRFGCRGHT